MEHDLSLQRADELKPPVATLRAMSDYAIATAPEDGSVAPFGCCADLSRAGARRG
jgi:hypothetical protein